MRYRLANLPGASYFFTVNLAERKSRLLVDHVDVLRESVRRVKTAHPFVIDAMVIMPDHLHTLWTLPEGDSDFSTRWGLIKSGFSRQLEVTERISPSRQTKGERGIWQRRFLRHAQDKFGSILSEMITTLNAMSIIFTIIRSNMVLCYVL